MKFIPIKIEKAKVERIIVNVRDDSFSVDVDIALLMTRGNGTQEKISSLSLSSEDWRDKDHRLDKSPELSLLSGQLRDECLLLATGLFNRLNKQIAYVKEN